MAQCRGKSKSTGKRCGRTVKGGNWCKDHPPEEVFDEMDANGEATQAQFARIIGRSDERVRQLRKQGVIALEPSGKLDVAKSIEALIVHGDLSRSSLPFDLYEKHVGPLDIDADEDSEGLVHRRLVAEVELKVHQARKARLQADEIEGLLVSAEDARRDWFTVSRQTRDKLMSVPDRLAASLVGRTDEHEIYEMLSTEIRQALADLDGDLEEAEEAA